MDWEAEIERDFSPGGRGGAFLAEMKADARAGKYRPFELPPKSARRKDAESIRQECPARRYGPCECDIWALRRNAAWRARKRWLREHRKAT